MKTALLILVLCLVTPAMVSAQSPSLADIARRERDRQKNTKSGATFTNETIGTAVAEPAPAAPPAGPAASALATDKPGAEPAKLSATDETGWREAFKNARDDVKRTEDRSKVLQLELNQLNMDLLTRSDIYNREGVIVPQITAKQGELAVAEAQTDQAKQKVTQLEEDLRRAGAPAGWAR